MHLSTLFLSSLLAATTIALPSHDLAPSLSKRKDFAECYQECMDGCKAPTGYARCEIPCSLNCGLDFNHGQHYTETNLDDYVHNREGTLECYGRFGS